MLAFEGESAAASLREAWGVYKTLPPETRKKLTSSALPLRLRSLAGDFSVKGTDLVRMSGIIRELFFNKKTVAAAAEEISSFSGADKGKLAEFIEKNVLTVEPDPETVSVAAEGPVPVSSEKLPLLAALAKYARLSEQQLSRDKIRIKNQSESVRPSLVNWLRSYRDELGVGYHDPVLRAKFLFNSPNCKSLSSEERERLNLILRSVEDNVPLDIDVRRMEIIFPSFSVTDGHSAPPKAPAAQMPAPEKKTPIEGKPKSLLETLQSTPVAAPGAKPFTPPQAPKRAVPPVPAPAVPQTPAAPRMAEPEGGFRIGKGMHFTSLEQKPVPEKKPTMGQEEKFSFSSNHTLQAEQGNLSKFAIKQPSGNAIASGESFFDKPKGSAPDGPSPAQKMNPFQIRPVSLHGKSGDEDMGRIVDLKND